MDVGDVARVYDRIAERYAAVFSDELDRKPDDRRLLDAVAAACRGRGVVLDVGCGPGHVAAYLYDAGTESAGVDLTPAMAAAAHRRHPAVPCVVADLRRLPVADGRAAGVVAFYSLIHLPRPDLRAAVESLGRVLVPDGVLLVAVHGGEGQVHADEFVGERLSVDATLFTAAELAAAVEAAGCTVEQVLERPPYDFEHPTTRLYVRARKTG
ncbi:MAG TPA: class I SAM-dependent methyltransferase [Acidimicrobiia bacterium]|nr:class I SAM-dependent methyltransferase [Acidimicrobiia bacterium]